MGQESSPSRFLPYNGHGRGKSRQKKIGAYKLKKLITLFIIVIISTACSLNKTYEILDPLPSWNEGRIKAQIISFVDQATDPSGKNYIPVQDRIATFDFDGTIFCEKPIYANFAVSIEHYRKTANEDTTLRSMQPYKAALENDYDYMNHHLVEFLTFDYTEKPEEDYIQSVSSFMDTTIHTELNIPYRNLFYIPMIELIEFLIQKDFQVFISSGSMTGFLRGACKDILPLDTHQIIGSRIELEYSIMDSSVVFLRKEEIIHNNDAKGKALGIYNHIGKASVIAAGNTEGDIEMLQYAAEDKAFPHLILVVNHDDNKREYEYYDKPLLNICNKQGWFVISMKEDFKNIFIE